MVAEVHSDVMSLLDHYVIKFQIASAIRSDCMMLDMVRVCVIVEAQKVKSTMFIPTTTENSHC